MTRTQLTQASAIIKKELLEASRTGWSYVLATLALSTYIQWFTVRNYLAMARKVADGTQQGIGLTADQLMALAPTLSLVFVAPIVVPFVSNGILSRSLIRERLLGTLLPLLATGVDSGLVWTSKVLAAFFFSYAVALAAVGINLAMVSGYFHLTIAWSPALIVTVLLLAPVVSLAIVAVMSFLFWTVKAARFIAATLPVVTSMALFGYVSMNPPGEILLKGVLLATVGALVLLWACALGISRLNRRFVVGL